MKLTDQSVSTQKLANNAVEVSKINNGAVEPHKLHSTALARMAPTGGATGQYLRKAANGALEWVTPTVALTRVQRYSGNWAPNAILIWKTVDYTLPADSWIQLSLGRNVTATYSLSPLLSTAEILAMETHAGGTSLGLTVDDFVAFTVPANTIGDATQAVTFYAGRDPANKLTLASNYHSSSTADRITPLRVLEIVPTIS